MPMMGVTDTLAAKPKFPLERTQHGTIKLTLGNTVTFPTSTMTFQGTTANGVANTWVANVANIGNTFGLQGWNEVGPSVVNIAAAVITLSQAVGNTIPNAANVIFSKPVVRAGTIKANTSANTYNANTYLVSATRMTNANSILESALFKTSTIKSSTIAHTGWVLVQPQTGYVNSLTVKNSVNVANGGFVIFTANTQYPGGSGANASFSVNATGYITTLTVNNHGSGYVLTPNAMANGASLTVTMGGRANRILTEVLSIVANTNVTDPTSGGLWLNGV
jgi:hypothetical protein